MSKQKFNSSLGLLTWAFITGEGTEDYNGNPIYSVQVVVDADSPDVEAIEAFWEANKPPGFTKDPKSLGIYPYKAPTGEKDEDGKDIYEEVEGKVCLAFTTKTTYKDGKPKVIRVYNSKNAEVSLGDTLIGNGSEGRAGGSMAIYTAKNAKTKKIIDAGVTLFLDKVQITKLVEFEMESGFDAVDCEDGFTGVNGGGFDGTPADNSFNDDVDSAPARSRL